ncbi:MAG: hypothetical protein AAF514_20270, partial [Verrucomicrobiota bacterium]
FTFAVARDSLIIDRFFFTDLSWVEAAWSSIQVLSWQNIVLGDPLARARVKRLPFVSLEGSTGLFENDAPQLSFTVKVDRVLEAPLPVRLNFRGMTNGIDYESSIPISPETGHATIILQPGQPSASFPIRFKDDTAQEGLEILSITVRPSPDENGDGFGDAYSFLNPESIHIALAETPFDLWRFQHFENDALEDGAPWADPDADGLSNLEEYALFRHPLSARCPNSNLNVHPTLKLGAEDHFLSVRLPDHQRPDIRIHAQRSENLRPSSWATTATRDELNEWSGTSTIIQGADHEINLSMPTGRDEKKAFFRILVENVGNP